MSRPTSPHTRSALTVLPLLVLIPGCGGTIAVEGTVTFNGEPVAEGSISFEAPDGSTPTFGGRIENGAYHIVDLPGKAAGTRVVRVVASRKTGRKVPAGPPAPPGTMVDEIERAPARYNDRSTLTAELQRAGPNRYDFALQSDKPSR